MNLLTSTVSTLCAVLASSTDLVVSAAHVHPAVHRSLRSQGTVNIFVTLRAGTQSALAAAAADVQQGDLNFTTRGQQISSLVALLELNANDSQKEAMAVVVAQEKSQGNVKIHSFWMTNQLYIEGATEALVAKLAKLRSVSQIDQEEIIHLETIITPQVANNSTISAAAVPEYGVATIRATEVWAKGYTGQGIVVGHIDTGVLASHVALKSNFRSKYNWFDPQLKRSLPYDSNGHGTHTMGTIAGSNGIGVAPGATWISCKGCRGTSCSQSDLLTCFEFMTCPTTPLGKAKDCSMAPRVVSNSWGGGQGGTTYSSAISVWRTAGIIPVFANGNGGPACGTASSPGDNTDVIAVGATDSTNALASFSSKGPSVFGGLVKPDVAAPGVSVRSSWSTSTSAFATISGTSMATPHVAGAIALLLSYKPTMTFDEIKASLTANAARALPASGYTCGGTADTAFPNNQYGYGRIDVLAAFNSVQPV